MDTTLKRRRPPRFDLTSGAVCLDFVNTLDDRFSDQPKELLANYIDLARFGEDAGILTTLQVDRLFSESMQSPEPAEQALASAIKMREAIYGVFWALAKKKPTPPGALFTLNAYIEEGSQHARLVPGTPHFEWEFPEIPLTMEAPLWPIARSAAELLVSDQLRYVRACDSKTCQWLFLDLSKNHRRRWCDMTRCGNRAKFQRFYSRARNKKK